MIASHSNKRWPLGIVSQLLWCEMFLLDVILVPVWSVAIWRHAIRQQLHSSQTAIARFLSQLRIAVQSVAAVLVLPAFSRSYITTLAAVAWQVQHAAMSSSLVVLLQLTALMYLCFRKMTLAPVARLGRRGTRGRRGCWRGRRGTWRHPPSFHVACVVLGDIDWACTFAASLALLRTLWHVWSGWDCRTCVICSHLTPYIYIYMLWSALASLFAISVKSRNYFLHS